MRNSDETGQPVPVPKPDTPELGRNPKDFELIFDAIPDAALVTRLDDGLIIDANPAFLSIAGLTKAEIIGKIITDLNLYAHPDERGKVTRAVRENGFCENLEILLRRKNGETGFFLISAITVLLQGQLHIVSIIRDISDRKKMEEALRKSEERYRILSENIKDVIWLLDPETMRILYVSPSVYGLCGYTAEEVMDGPFDATLTPADADNLRRAIRRAVADFVTGRSNPDEHIMQEFPLICKDGSSVWAELISTIYRNRTNGRPELLGVTRDISSRKLVEQKLQRSEEKYRLLIENATDTILVVQNGIIQYCNPKAGELSGYLPAKLISMPFEEFVVPADLDLVLPPDRHRDPDENASGPRQFRWLRQDQNVRWVEMTAVPIEWEGQAATLNFLTDITERKQSEEEILYLSYHDQLTGLYNRRFYEEELKRLDASRNLPISIVMADVNGLKLTNDAFGHVVGDKLLQEIALILKNECRSDDIVARIGGDEFILLLPRVSMAEAKALVQRIQLTLHEQRSDNRILSVSFGWATKTDSNTPIADIYIKAENRMYRHKLAESTRMKRDTLTIITKSLYEKNAREQQHCEHVSELCRRIGGAMNLKPDEINDLGLLGVVHDIGKIGIDARILNKTGGLDANERIEIQRHPEIGYQILRAVNEFLHIAEYVLAHHERLDGTGYPRGLKGSDIPLQSRILAIAEAYDAMRTNNGFQQGMDEKAALAELDQNAGTQFDPEIVRLLAEKVLR